MVSSRAFGTHWARFYGLASAPVGSVRIGTGALPTALVTTSAWAEPPQQGRRQSPPASFVCATTATIADMEAALCLIKGRQTGFERRNGTHKKNIKDLTKQSTSIIPRPRSYELDAKPCTYEFGLQILSICVEII